MPVDLNAQNETVMAMLRGTVSELKVAAISAILYAEEQPTPARQNVKLHDAIQWLVQEIAQNDPRAGLMIKAQVDKLLQMVPMEPPRPLMVDEYSENPTPLDRVVPPDAE